MEGAAHSIMTSRIRTVVIPAAGLGTRCLPATKVIPKEMLPVGDRPLIQYAVEEAVASGATTVILVISPGKELLAQHFEPSPGLEAALRERGQVEEAREILDLTELAQIRTVYQSKPLGLANAIQTVEPLIEDEPFGVILPDALIYSDVPCIGQLMDCYATHLGCIVAVRQISETEVERFGVVITVPEISEAKRNSVVRVKSLLERPRASDTASRFGIFGRYVLTPEIFSSIRDTPVGRGGEFQLTDALARYATHKPVFGCLFEGEHYDVGSKLGFVQATLAFALKNATLSADVRSFLSQFGTADLYPAQAETDELQ